MNQHNNDNKLLSHERKIAHMKAGYDNAQNAVRFIDTKATAVLGATTTVVGLTISAFSWSHESIVKYFNMVENWEGYWMCIPIVGFVLVCSAIILALLVIWFCFGCFLPRDIGNSNPSVLFPFIPEDGVKDLKIMRERGLERIKTVGNNMSEVNEVEDYSSQLGRMGEIIYAKVTASKKALSCFKFLLILSVLASISVVFMKFSYEFHKEAIDSIVEKQK